MKKLLMFLCICTCCLTNICFAKEVEVTSDYIPILVQTKTHDAFNTYYQHQNNIKNYADTDEGKKEWDVCNRLLFQDMQNDDSFFQDLDKSILQSAAQDEESYILSISKIKDLAFDKDEVVVTSANFSQIKPHTYCIVFMEFDEDDYNLLYLKISATVEIDEDSIKEKLAKENAKLHAENEVYKDVATDNKIAYQDLQSQKVNPASYQDTNAENLVKLANQAFISDNFTQAIQYAQQATVNSSTGEQVYEKALFMLAQSYAELNDFDTAFSYVNMILEQNPLNYDARVFRMQLNWWKFFDERYMKHNPNVSPKPYGDNIIEDYNFFAPQNHQYPVHEVVPFYYFDHVNINRQDCVSNDNYNKIMMFAVAGYAMQGKQQTSYDTLQSYRYSKAPTYVVPINNSTYYRITYDDEAEGLMCFFCYTTPPISEQERLSGYYMGGDPRYGVNYEFKRAKLDFVRFNYLTLTQLNGYNKPNEYYDLFCSAKQHKNRAVNRMVMEYCAKILHYDNIIKNHNVNLYGYTEKQLREYSDATQEYYSQY